jgi:hypothetical protein
MAFQIISHDPESLLQAFRETAALILYPSESDAPIEVHHVGADKLGDQVSPDEIRLHFYGDEDPKQVESSEWAEANRLESNGTQRFFRDQANIITTYPNNEYFVHELYHRENTPHWRKLRDLFFDNLVQQRWFRVDFSGSNDARADIFLVGRHLQIELDADTNEIRTTPLDWVVLKTFVIET